MGLVQNARFKLVYRTNRASVCFVQHAMNPNKKREYRCSLFIYQEINGLPFDYVLPGSAFFGLNLDQIKP
jgi:hypothetical protein